MRTLKCVLVQADSEQRLIWQNMCCAHRLCARFACSAECYCSAEAQTLLPSPVLREHSSSPRAVLVTTEPCRGLWVRANVSVTACSFWCHKLQAVCLVFLSDLESVNAALAVRSGCWGQCCSRLALATRGSAVFLDPVDLQNEQLGYTGGKLLKELRSQRNAYQPIILSWRMHTMHSACQPKPPEENVYSLHVCHSCWATYHPQSMCSKYYTHSALASTQTKPPTLQMWIWPKHTASFPSGNDSKHRFIPEVQFSRIACKLGPSCLISITGVILYIAVHMFIYFYV